MRHNRIHITFCCIFVLCAAFAQVARSELVVAGPDLKPLANRDILVAQPWSHGTESQSKPLTLTTDDKGILRYQFENASTLYVTGVGYATIMNEFGDNGTFKSFLPPLVPFASIEGALPPEPRFANIEVHAGTIYGQNENHSAIIDDQGHFKITDLPAGIYWLYAGPNNNRAADLGHQVVLVPGQHLRDVSLKPVLLAEMHPQAPIHRAPLPGEGQTVVWVAGTVRDDAGKPISDATVYALAVYHGGMRMYEQTAKATSNEKGYYELKGPGGLTMFSATLLATAPGKPAAWAWPAFPDSGDKWIPVDAATQPAATLPAPPTQDFTLSSRGCSLDVTVLSQGDPIVGAAVGVYLENANLKDQWAAGGGDPETRAAVENAAYPVATTNDKGIVKFTNLLPGRYRIIATVPKPPTPGNTQFDDPVANIRYMQNNIFRELIPPYAIADGIPLALDKPATFRISIYPKANPAKLRLLRHDASPLTEHPAFSWGRVDSVQWNSGIATDESGTGQHAFEAPGLWYFEAYYRLEPVKFVPFPEPFFAAIGTLAVSPNLGTITPTYTARFIRQASARIKVLDIDGKPLRAAVQIERPQNLAIVAGSTDNLGTVYFPGLTAWNDYVVRAFATGLNPVDLGDRESPLPDIKLLENHTEILGQPLAAVRDQETPVTLRAQKVGYVYGTVAPSPDGKRRYCFLSSNTPTSSAATTHLRCSTGEYAAGPFAEGPVDLVLYDINSGHSATFSTIARAGTATRFDFAEPDRDPALTRTTGGTLLVGAGGASMPTTGAQNFAAQVFLADNKTPALGAQIFCFEPRKVVPAVLAFTDAKGNAMPRGFWRNMNAVPPSADLGSPSPVYLAFLPGACGATILPPPEKPTQPLRFVLPRPISLSGQITVAGVAPTHRPGCIRILATYQDKGFLNPYLSVQTTTDADGRFTLAGLTPGNYQIQAALDDIWLSPASQLQIADENPDPITLAIPAPGAPVVIHVNDAAGKPAIGKSITLDRPAGPLTQSLWPKQWTSDGAGLINIPTLEAGPHILHVPGHPDPVTVQIPPLPADKPSEVTVIIDH